MGADDFIKRTVEKSKELADSPKAERLKQAAAQVGRSAARKAQEARDSDRVQQAKSQAKHVGTAATAKLSAAKNQRAEKKQADDVRERVAEMREKALRGKASPVALGAGTAFVVNPVAGSVVAATLVLRNMYLKRDEEKQKRLREEAGIPEAEWQEYVARLRAEKRATEAAAKRAEKERLKQETERREADRARLEAEEAKRLRLKAEQEQREREPDVEEVKKAWALIQQELREDNKQP